MTVSTIPKTKRDGSLLIYDNSGAGGGNTLTVPCGPGNFTEDVPGETINNIKCRGRIQTGMLRYGDDQEATGSFSYYLADLTDAAAATMMDILNLSGYVASNWVSTGGANAEVMSYGMKWTIEGTDHGDGADHTATYTDVTFTRSTAEGDPDEVTVSWQMNGAIRPTLT